MKRSFRGSTAKLFCVSNSQGYAKKKILKSILCYFVVLGFRVRKVILNLKAEKSRERVGS